MSEELSKYWLQQADAAYEEQHWQSALSAYEDTARLAPGCAQARLGAALSLLALNRPLEALHRLDSLTTREARFAAAVAELLLGRRTALTLFEASLTLGCRGLQPRLPAKALTRALHRLEEGLRLQPGNPAAWTFRGVLLEWLGCTSEAFGSLAAALEVEPGYAPAARLQDAWLTEALCLPAPRRSRREEPQEGPVALALEARPTWYSEHLLGDDAEALYARAVTYYTRESWEEALEYLRRVNMVDPEHLNACSLRFEVLIYLNRAAEARQEGYHLMDLLERHDRLNDAIEFGNRMFQLWPEEESLLCKHQLLFHRAGDVHNAARWTFELVRRHRFAQQINQASASLYWLLRTPISGGDRVRAELLLLAILLAAQRFEPALDRLEVLLAQWEASQLTGERSYSRRAGTVRRLLESAGAAGPRLGPLLERLETLRAASD